MIWLVVDVSGGCGGDNVITVSMRVSSCLEGWSNYCLLVWCVVWYCGMVCATVSVAMCLQRMQF